MNETRGYKRKVNMTMTMEVEMYVPGVTVEEPDQCVLGGNVLRNCSEVPCAMCIFNSNHFTELKNFIR